MPSKKPTHIFWDIGGVLLEFEHQRIINGLLEIVRQNKPDATVDNINEVFRSAQSDELYLRAARFEQAEDEYFEGLIAQFKERFDADLTFQQAEELSNSIWVGRVEENIATLKSMINDYKVGILSDQVRTCKRGAIERLEDVLEIIPANRTFISCDCGHIKGEGTIWFEEVNELTRTNPDECMQIDDSPQKVELARRAGWHAVLAPKGADATPVVMAYLESL